MKIQNVSLKTQFIYASSILAKKYITLQKHYNASFFLKK